MNQPTDSAPPADGSARQLLAVLTVLWLLVMAWLYWRWWAVTTGPVKGPMTIVLNGLTERRGNAFLDFRGVKELLWFVALVIAGPVVLAAVAAVGRLQRVAIGYAVLGAALGVPAAIGTYLHLRPYLN